MVDLEVVLIKPRHPSLNVEMIPTNNNNRVDIHCLNLVYLHLRVLVQYQEVDLLLPDILAGHHRMDTHLNNNLVVDRANSNVVNIHLDFLNSNNNVVDLLRDTCHDRDTTHHIHM